MSVKSEKAIQQTASVKFKLSWSHYLKLMRIDDENERKFYEIESFKKQLECKGITAPVLFCLIYEIGFK